MPTPTTTPVAEPTWYSDIRQLFTDTDITHMRSQGLDLSIYDVVKDNAMIIYGQVASGGMPPPPEGPWPQDWVTTFFNWINTGCPKGTNAPSPMLRARLAAAAPSTATRIRKDITTLSETEMATLIKAFNGILAKAPSDPNSFFMQAGIHWLPGTNGRFFCQHHVPGYNPWHRAYLLGFENALRSVEGCENVTLPYWDITTPFPDVLKQAPFASYTLPQAVGTNFPAGYTTARYDYATIQQNLLNNSVTDDLNRALTQTDWEDFHGFWSGASYDTIIAAHDGGHVSIGPTMASPLVAAFDPIFFFFHANWDRLFWKWQTSMQATDLNSLLSTINQQTDAPSYQIFTLPAFEALAPFPTSSPNLTTLGIINSVTQLDVDYEEPQTARTMSFAAKLQRAVPASAKVQVQTDRVNVRVAGVNRLKIPGSFSVHLLKDGERIASKAFFQTDEAEKCETCVKNAIANFDFKLPLETVSAGKLSVVVEPVDKSVVGDRFPHKMMGNPTIEVHMLLGTE